MITGLLVVAGIVLAVLSVVSGHVLLAYVALGVAVAAALALFLPRWSAAGASVRERTKGAPREKGRTRRLRPVQKKRQVGETVAETASNGTGPDPVEARAPEEAKAAVAGGSPESRPPGPVLVVPGRHRYHVEGCEVLQEHRSDRLSLDEALDEGFTPCTRCQPDGARRPQPQS